MSSNIKEEIRAEIIRRIANKDSNEYANPILRAELRGLLAFINSLPDEQQEHPLEILAKKCPQEDIDPKIAQCIADHWWEMLDDEPTPSKKCEKTEESALKKCEEVDLEQAAEEYENNHTYQRYDGGGFTPEYNATLAEAFKAGAKWQREQMMMDAIDAHVSKIGGSGFVKEERYSTLMAYLDKFKDGDKVKVIIVKKEDE